MMPIALLKEQGTEKELQERGRDNEEERTS